MTVNVLALAAHRDDVEITCGGTMIKFADRGHKTAICDFTAGEMGTRGDAADRAAEAEAAAKIMKLSHRENLELPDAKLENTLDARMKAAAVVRRLRPHLVILPHWVQRHPDHRVAGEIAYDACYLSGLDKIDLPGEPHRPKKILYTSSFRPGPHSFHVDVTDQFARKLEAVRAYASQFGTKEGAREIFAPGVDIFDFMSTHARHAGMAVRVKYAETFAIKEAVLIDDPMTMPVPSI